LSWQVEIDSLFIYDRSTLLRHFIGYAITILPLIIFSTLLRQTLYWLYIYFISADITDISDYFHIFIDIFIFHLPLIETLLPQIIFHHYAHFFCHYCQPPAIFSFDIFTLMIDTPLQFFAACPDDTFLHHFDFDFIFTWFDLYDDTFYRYAARWWWWYAIRHFAADTPPAIDISDDYLLLFIAAIFRRFRCIYALRRRLFLSPPPFISLHCRQLISITIRYLFRWCRFYASADASRWPFSLLPALLILPPPFCHSAFIGAIAAIFRWLRCHSPCHFAFFALLTRLRLILLLAYQPMPLLFFSFAARRAFRLDIHYFSPLFSLHYYFISAKWPFHSAITLIASFSRHDAADIVDDCHYCH